METLSLKNKSEDKDYKLMLAGFYEHDSIWEKYEKIFTSNYIIDDNNYGRINSADVNSYAQAYNLMDIGLIPLSNNEFNRCKSDLKLVEMGAFGFSNITLPFQPQPGDFIRFEYDKNKTHTIYEILLFEQDFLKKKIARGEWY